MGQLQVSRDAPAADHARDCVVEAGGTGQRYVTGNLPVLHNDHTPKLQKNSRIYQDTA